ncbi:MAG TPA: hypothetical protein VF405_10170 [Gammaproteobacteria bacterium]
MSERVDAVAALDAPSSPRAAVVRTRQAYLGVALLIAGIVAWGFWKTYYSQALARTDLPAIVHVHAAVFSLWVLVLVAQAAVVAAGNVPLHKRLGTVGMAYGALVFMVGLLVSVGAPVVRVRAAFYPLEVGGIVALYNLTDMLLFGAFLALAFAYRNRPELHKRWIIAATAALCGAALGRVVPGNTPQYLLLWLSPLLALAAVDLAARRRVHWIPVVASALLVVAFFKVPLYSAPVWKEIGRALLRPFV